MMKGILLVVGLVALAGGVRADESPFLPPNAPTQVGKAADGSSYELRGVMSAGGVTKYCIYDPGKKSSTWVGVNEQGRGFRVKSADPARDTITLIAGGQTMMLSLHQAKVVSVAFSGPIAAPPPNGALGPIVLKPTPQDEQRRLQAIAEEVRRRRELRERAQAR